MKRFLMSISILVFFYVAFLFAGVTPAIAENIYISGKAGIALYPDTDFTIPGSETYDLRSKMGYSAGIALGKKYNDFRFEGELAYASTDVDKAKSHVLPIALDGEATATSIMVNTYYDVKTSGIVKPFIGAGIGYSSISLDFSIPSMPSLEKFKNRDSVFAYQFIGGVAFDINPKLKFDISYKYFGTSIPSVKVVFWGLSTDSFDVDYFTHNFQVGLRYSF